jgi:hypothetical protein
MDKNIGVYPHPTYYKDTHLKGYRHIHPKKPPEYIQHFLSLRIIYNKPFFQKKQDISTLSTNINIILEYEYK